MNDSIHMLDQFFYPKTVALIGVSKGFGFGAALPGFLKTYGSIEHLYLVNPRLNEIEGLRVHHAVRDLPAGIDLACILVPAAAVHEVVEECIKKGVKALVIMSAGFAETDQEGRTRQEELSRAISSRGVRVLGPNCIGVVNVHTRFATCEVLLEELTPGSISIVAQSGLFGNILLDWAPSQDIPIAKVATIGNRVDVDETDVLEYLGADKDTEVIVCYLESLKRPLAFLNVARSVSPKKPIVLYLGGQTEAGRRAVLSHTGSLGSSRKIEEGLLRQAGIHMAADPVELFDMARTFACAPLAQGNRIIVVTASGSLGVMAADALMKEGMQLPCLSEAAREKMRSRAPAWMNIANPLDVGPSGLFAVAMETALNEPEVHGIVSFPIIPWAVIKPLLKSQPDAVADLFVPEALRLKKQAPPRPIILSVPGHPEWRRYVKSIFGDHIPLTTTPQAAAKAMAALYRQKVWKDRSKPAA